MRTWRWSNDNDDPEFDEFRRTRMLLDQVEGPWHGEPDKAQWIDPTTDLDCLAQRGGLGQWCGYVGVPKDHPIYGAEIDDDRLSSLPIDFAAPCGETGNPRFGVCHVPEPGRERHLWWVGFSYARSGSLMPVSTALIKRLDEGLDTEDGSDVGPKLGDLMRATFEHNTRYYTFDETRQDTEALALLIAVMH